ncbi:hypothetical protein B0O99DRAFT_146584 [Bisporella sp. PMI_857]|nr:hypothetical protein B0O99DRAFT_146584 [Bisporella sp. PMI_857]
MHGEMESAFTIPTRGTPLDGLPNEILYNICEWLGADAFSETRPPTNIGARNIARLALCSRHLWRVTRDALYKAFVYDDFESAFLFLRTILVKPELALFVKEFVQYLHHSAFIEDTNSVLIRGLELGHTAYENLRTTMAELHPYLQQPVLQTDEPMHSIPNANPGCPIGPLLLFLLPNLEIITTVSKGLAFDNFRPGRVAYVAYRLAHSDCRNGRTPPQKLKSVFRYDIGRQNTFYNHYHFHNVVNYLQIASVEEAKIFGMVEGNWKFNVTSLTFSGCCLDGYLLMLFLRKCPNVKKLLYDKGSINLTDYGTPFTAYRFHEAIAHLEPCLEELVLLNDWRATTSETSGPSLKPESLRLGIMTQFQNLRRLDTNIFILIGAGRERLCLVDVLPCSLRNLRLTGITGFPTAADGHDLIRDLIERKETAVPLLKNLALEFSWDGGPEFDEYSDALKQQCHRAKVNLVVETHPPRLSSEFGTLQTWQLPSFS